MKILLISFCIFFLITLSFANVESVNGGILFTYDSPDASEVYIAGNFNNWNSTKDKLKKGENGIWKIVLPLSPGKYQYKFVVDGNWYYDPDNPITEDDGYGGSNSVIEVDKNGKLILSKFKKSFSGIKSGFNPKIFFTGRYYAQNKFVKDNNYRYYLQKPSHDINLGIKVKLNKNFQAFTLLNINNTKENSDMWKTHLNYKKSYVTLNTEIFKITAFDNFGIITSNDPLHIIGNMGKNKYNFGYDRRGILLKTSEFNKNNSLINIPITFKGEALFSDKSGSEENDINFERLILDINLNPDNNGYVINHGFSFYSFNTRTSENERKRHISNEIDISVNKYFYKRNWANFMKISAQTEFLTFKNSDLYDDYKQNPYIISPSYDWMNGNKLLLGLKTEFPKALTIQSNIVFNKVNFYFPKEQSQYTPAPYLLKKSLKRLTYIFKSNFELPNFSIGLNLSYWNTTYPDSLVNWNDYFKYLEFTNGSGRWFENYSYFTYDKLTLLGYKNALLWKSYIKYSYYLLKNLKIQIDFQTKFAHQNFFFKPKYSEFIFAEKIIYKNNWNFYYNIRFPIYNDRLLNLITDFKKNKNIYLDNYIQISYKPKNNIEILIGYGLNPEVLNKTTDEFYWGGREEYLLTTEDTEEFLQTGYKGIEEKIKTSEKKLMNEKIISIDAKLSF